MLGFNQSDRGKLSGTFLSLIYSMSPLIKGLVPSINSYSNTRQLYITLQKYVAMHKLKLVSEFSLQWQLVSFSTHAELASQAKLSSYFGSSSQKNRSN